MRAATYPAYSDDFSTLRCALHTPKVGPATVLIEVRAAGVNPVDWKVMSGGLDLMMDWLPRRPRLGCRGTVIAVGLDTRSSRSATR